LSKLHREATQAKITPELLAKQHFDIRFVINHKNEKFHIRPLSIASLHGRMTRAQETSTSAPARLFYRGFPPGPHRFSRSASSCSQLIAKKLAVSYPNTIGELEDLHDVLLAGHIDRMLFHRSVISHCGSSSVGKLFMPPGTVRLMPLAGAA